MVPFSFSLAGAKVVLNESFSSRDDEADLAVKSQVTLLPRQSWVGEWSNVLPRYPCCGSSYGEIG